MVVVTVTVVVVIVEVVAVVAVAEVVVSVSVVTVLEVCVTDVAVVEVAVVVVQRPPANEATELSQLRQIRSRFAVCSLYTYWPATHGVVGVHWRSRLPGCGLLLSYSPAAHSVWV